MGGIEQQSMEERPMAVAAMSSCLYIAFEVLPARAPKCPDVPENR